MKTRTLPTLAYLSSALLVVILVSGCRMFNDKRVDVSGSPAWWGELGTNRVVRLKEDALIYRSVLTAFPVIIYNTDGTTREVVSVEKFRQCPRSWPEISLVGKGTRLRCSKLVRYFNMSWSHYVILATLMDGASAGRTVEVTGMLGGNPREKGSLSIVRPEFLEIAR